VVAPVAPGPVRAPHNDVSQRLSRDHLVFE
jgi:hypothetical protein